MGTNATVGARACKPTREGPRWGNRRGRTLTSKMLAGLGLSFGVWCVLLYVTNASLLRPRFDGLERSTLMRNCERVGNAIEDSGATLSSKVGDWALWDDTYEFMHERTADYVEANLNPESMETLGLDFMIFLTPEGEIVHLALRGPEFGGRVTAEAVTRLLAEHPRLMTATAPRYSRSGLLVLGGEFAMLAVRSIHRSDRTGASRGRLLAGRLFDRAAVDGLARLTRLPLRMEAARPDGAAVQVTCSESRIAASLPIADMFGEPLAAIVVEQPREIHRQGEEALAMLVVALLISSGLAMAATAIGVDRFVLVRLRRLRSTMARIARTGDLTDKAELCGDDEITDLSAAFNDLTTRLLETQQQLLRADRARSEFLANVSHELRTPAAALLGFVDLIDGEELSRDQRSEFVDTIRRNAQHLLTILNDLLDSAKVESGQMAIEAITTELLPLLRDAVEVARPTALQKGLELSLRTRGDLPRAIRTDPTRLRQILCNLLGNAVKFTERGHVHLEVEGDGPDLLRLRVVDTGIGITAEQQRRLFTPFVQADASTNRRFGGTGLGLALSRALARRLGGDITLQSETGEGSTFELVLPTGCADVAAGGSPAVGGSGPGSVRDAVRLEGRRILVADDARDNGRLISFVLAKAGADVEVVENGRLAVDACARLAAHATAYDLVILDMQMPVLDGYAAAAQLRTDGYRGPVLALTANAMRSDRDRCIAAGCTDYATKPIDRTGLLQRVAELLEASPAVRV